MIPLHKPLILLFTILLISRAHSSLEGHACSHKQYFEPQFIEVEDKDSILHLQQDRNLQSTIYPNIRIYAHYDYLIVSAPSSYAAYIQNELVPPIIDYYQAALKVKYPVNGNLKLGITSTDVCGKQVPTILQTTGVPADYFIFFDSVQNNGTTMASSNYCLLSAWTKRPLVARTVLTRSLLVEAKGDVLVHEKNMYVLMHEMMHTLGFSSDLFFYFLDENANQRKGHIKRREIGGANYTVIDIPVLTNKLQAFFGCTTLEGAIMENNGADGSTNSHFERRFFLYEVMSPSGIDGRRVSEFSLTMLEASGWYIPDYSYAEPYFYGRGQGCGFINGVCQNSSYKFDEFCSGSGKGCSDNGRSGGYCNSDTFSDGCKYYIPNKSFDCENGNAGNGAVLSSMQVYGRGAGSKCFAGTLSTKKSSTKSTYCFKYNCVGSGSSTRLEIQVGNNKVVCDKVSQKTAKGLYGTVDCPDPLQFCNTVGVQYCPRNCLGRGICVNNQCQCNKGFGGVDCALAVTA